MLCVWTGQSVSPRQTLNRRCRLPSKRQALLHIEVPDRTRIIHNIPRRCKFRLYTMANKIPANIGESDTKERSFVGVKIISADHVYLRNLPERRKSFSQCLSLDFRTQVANKYMVVFWNRRKRLFKFAEINVCISLVTAVPTIMWTPQSWSGVLSNSFNAV
jgi:hypothetical protein